MYHKKYLWLQLNININIKIFNCKSSNYFDICLLNLFKIYIMKIFILLLSINK